MTTTDSMDFFLDLKLKTKNILLLSSAPRSGSSFLARIISSNPNTFYVYEPSEFFRSYPASYTKILSEIYTCKFDKLNLGESEHSFRPPSCSRDSPCTKKKDKEILNSICNKSSIILVKTIEVRVKTVVEILNSTNLQFKIIHLYRDPRGSLNSILNLGWHPRRGNCTNLESDLDYSTPIMKSYPKRYVNSFKVS